MERELEAQTIALNEWMYADSIGLEVDPAGGEAPAAALAGLYARLTEAVDPAVRYFAVENWAETRRLAHDQRVDDALDAGAVGPWSWRNWKAFERQAGSAAELQAGFAQWVTASAVAAPALEARWAAMRADAAAHGLTPVETFAWREGVSVPQLRAQLEAAGRAAAQPFQAALAALSAQVFGRPAGSAELHALYLNRMYEPLAPLFAGPTDWVADTLAVFTSLGFDLAGLPVDLVDRPRKYPGAFCFPVAIPGDVRVSVQIASPHHLVDMLYHEFGHAAHFSRVAAELPFIDRYWIQAGTHETFATLFEYLLAEPQFLAGRLGVAPPAVQALLEFARFKRLLTETWHSAAALTALDAWEHQLSWPAVEARCAERLAAFTGLAFPPGFARLHPYVNALSIYPAGYVLAEARVARWLTHLRASGGPEWWWSSAAQADIRWRAEQGAGAASRWP